MSIDSVRWAFSTELKPATTKFVLVAMADRADEFHQCYPSTDRLARDTSLDRKTVIRAVKDLQKRGLIRDTGERRGATRQVRVFQLMGVIGREQIQAHNDRLNDPEIGTVKDSQKRNSTENGTVPIFPTKGPKNSTLKGPKNGTQNRSVEPIREPGREKYVHTGSRLPEDWSLPDDWRHWAIQKGMDANAVDEAAETFKDYWIATPGQKGRKLDWFATWRNWIRRELEKPYSKRRQRPEKQGPHVPEFK